MKYIDLFFLYGRCKTERPPQTAFYQSVRKYGAATVFFKIGTCNAVVLYLGGVKQVFIVRVEFRKYVNSGPAMVAQAGKVVVQSFGVESYLHNELLPNH